MKKLYLLVVFVFFHFILLHGQVSGDFRSKTGGSGLWNDYHAWETYNGSLWVAATGGQLPDRDLLERNHAYYPATPQHGLTEVHTNSTSTSLNDTSRDLNFVSTQPTKPLNKINEDFPDTIKIGLGFDYPTLTGVGGLFEKLNTSGVLVNKNLLVIIKNDLSEIGNIALNAWKEGSGGPFTITIHPKGTRIITVNSVNGIKLNGTKGLIIDGLNDGVNSLSLIKSSGGGSSGVIEISNGATNNTITRLSLSSYNSYVFAFVIVISNSTIYANTNNTISYCSISSFDTSSAVNATYRGILLTGKTSTANGTLIEHNTFKNFSNSAIHQENGYFTNTTISNNEIYNTVSVSSGDNYKGIYLYNYIGKTNIFNNKIHDILCKSGSTDNSISAINCSTFATDSLNIYNNLIYLDAAVTQTGLAINGIFLYNSGIATLRYNTIYIGGINVLSKGSNCFYSDGLGNVSISNNIFENARSNDSGKGIHYGLFNSRTFNAITSKNNNIHTSGKGGCFGHYLIDYLTLKDWQNAKIQDANSISVDPQFTSTSDFVPLNAALNIGTPIPGITTDINGTLRDVTSPTLGAYEFPCNNPTSAGAIASDQTVWDNDMSALITSSTPASGYSGILEYKWQSTVFPFSGWTNIPTSNTLTYQPVKITETTLFKRLARTDCKKTWNGAAETNVVTITYSTNKWKGTINSDWSNPLNWTRNVVPAEGADIVFDDHPIHNCQLDQDRSVNSITISSGAQLIIPVDKQLQVNGKIINHAGTNGLVIKASPTGVVANGSLIFLNDLTQDPAVQATVEMYTKASRVNGSYRWQFFGIPVKSLPANPTFAGSYVREMHENVIGTTGHWVQLQNESVLTSFTGYEITQDSGKIIRFEGTLENCDYGPVELSYTPAATYKGEHLIANPYTAAIAIKNSVTPANSLTFGEKMDKTVYLYNTGSRIDWSANELNGSGNNDAPGQYLAVPQENAGSGDLPVSIPSMQAFLVMVNTPGPTATVSIPYRSAGTIVKNTTSQRAPAVEKVFTRIDVTGSNSGDRMWLFTEPSCSRGFDNGWDGYKLMGSALMPQIYASEPDADYQVNSTNDINDTYLGFVAGMDTTYTLTFAHHNTTTRYREIYLLDLIENKTVNITANKSQYTFLAKSGSPVEMRFKIIATPADPDMKTDIKSTQGVSPSITVFRTENTIIVNNQSSLNGNLYLYDLTGRCICEFQFNANSICTFPIRLVKGSYLSKAVTVDHEVTTKLIFEK